MPKNTYAPLSLLLTIAGTGGVFGASYALMAGGVVALIIYLVESLSPYE